MEKYLDVIQTQVAIKKLNLVRVSAPLFVAPETGLNDNLNGIEKPVSFTIKTCNQNVQIVQSLAKWKRMALGWYGFQVGTGLYTDMNAIRPYESLDNIHSVYVDQWDWEKVISSEERNEKYLIKIVSDIYEVFKESETYINSLYPKLKKKLPEKIYFITTQELEDLYPDKTPKEREDLIAKDKGAVFLMKIGKILNSGKRHDGRAPDYDDWNLNGDILFWNPILNHVLELSSMGIRVDSNSLNEQLRISHCEERKSLEYHRLLLDNKLPLTVGGGIGQSRICMFFLEKKHIGEVQASVWTKDIIDECRENNIFLL